MGGSFENVIDERNYFILHLNGKSFPVSRTFFIRNTRFTPRAITSYKDITHVLFESSQLPFPKTLAFYNNQDLEGLVSELSSLKYPLIIKPASGTKSRGVIPFIETPEVALMHIKKALQESFCVIIQEMVRGKEYRVLMLDGKVLGALEMIPPYVIGDGIMTVAELTLHHNHNEARKILADPVLASTLATQGESLKSIPAKDKQVFLRLHSSLAEGGVTQDVTDKIHPTIAEVCAKAAHITGCDLAGIDIICDDITKPFKGQEFVFLEVNSKPDIYIHHSPNFGSPRNVTRAIIEYLFDKAL